MVQLYALDLQPLLAGGWEDLMPQLSRWRQKKVMSLCHDADRARSAGAGWLLDYALTEAGIPRDQRAIQLQPGGKPELVRGGVHFSLGHAGPWAVCALAGTPVGVDVELPRCTMATARRFFAPAEVAQVEGPARAGPARRPAPAVDRQGGLYQGLGPGPVPGPQLLRGPAPGGRRGPDSARHGPPLPAGGISPAPQPGLPVHRGAPPRAADFSGPNNPEGGVRRESRACSGG